MKRILLYIAIVLSISISLFNGCMSEGDKIDYYLADTTMGIWSQKFNKQINYYYGSSDTILLGTDNFETWSIKTNRFIDSVPKTKGDTIIYGIDAFETWRTKFNTAVDSSISDFVNLNTYFALHNTDSLVITTPVGGNNEALHPDVWDFGSEWNGYRYWMSFTPFPTILPNENENPCIVASNDKVTWETPIGLTNPISNQPPVSYNSDTELFYDAPNDSLYCFFRSWTNLPSGNRSILKFKRSKDGVVWADSGEVDLSGLGDITSTNNEYISPSFIKIGDKYYLYAVDGLQLEPNMVPYRLESDNLLGSYTNKDTLILSADRTFLSDMWPLVDWYVWHLNINYYNGKYFLLAYNRGQNASAAEMKESLYLTESGDGIDFVFQKTPIITNRWTDSYATIPVDKWDGKYYRSAMLPKDVNGQLGWDLWYTGFKSYRDVHPDFIGYAEILPVSTHIDYVEGGTNTIGAQRQQQIDSANLKLGNYLFCDDFQRIESGLTTSSSGDSYIAGNLANFRSDDSLYISTASAYFFIDLGITDYEISVDAKINDLIYITSGDGNGLDLWPKATNTSDVLRGYSGRKFALRYSGLTDIQNDYLVHPFIQDDINNFKWRIEGDNVKYYVNNKLMLDFIVTPNTISEANKDIVMAKTQFLLFIQNTSTTVFNITAKSL